MKLAKERPGFNRAAEYYEQVVIGDASHRTSLLDAILHAKEPDATQLWVRGPSAILLLEQELGAIQPAARKPDATLPLEPELDEIQPAVQRQDETQPEELELNVIPAWELELNETPPWALELNEIPPAGLNVTQLWVREQDETQPEELGETRCELLGVIPYGPGLRVSIPFSARYAFLFAPVQQCEFPFVALFLLQRGIRFSSRGGWQCESRSGEPVAIPYELELQAVPLSLSQDETRFLLQEPRGSLAVLRF